MKIKKNLWEYKLAFLDLETTGLSPKHNEIIEVGILLYDQESDQIEKEWEYKIAPSNIETASPMALKLNGYNDNPQSYKGNLKSAMIKINSLIDKECLIVGQNVGGFDLPFIYNAMESLGIKPGFSRRYLDLMGLAWWAVKDTDIPGISLENFCTHFNVSNDGAHGAIVDCRRTFEVYRKVSEFLKPSP